MKYQPAFNKIGTKGQDNESVSMNENFGVAMSKKWKSIPFTTDHGELINPEGDDKKVTTKEKKVPGGIEVTTTTIETPTPKKL